MKTCYNPAGITYAEPTERDLERLRRWWERLKKVLR